MYQKPVFKIIATLTVLFVVLFGAFQSAAAEAAPGTTLGLYLENHFVWRLTYDWSLTASPVAPQWTLFKGDTALSGAMVYVTRTPGLQEHFIKGRLCVQNTGSVPTDALALKVELFDGSGLLVAGGSIDASSYPVLAAGEWHCYDYAFTVPAEKFTPCAEYHVVAGSSILNHAGFVGQPYGPTLDQSATALCSPIPVHEFLDVSDTFGSSYRFGGNSSFKSRKTFTCDQDTGLITDLITSVYVDDLTPGPSASADFSITCHDLQVTKSAQTLVNRKYQWTIEKSAGLSTLTLPIGQTGSISYNVKLASTYVDSAPAAAGKITVHNPAPMAAHLLSVTDLLPGVNVSLTCPVAFPYWLPAGQSLTCDWAANLPDSTVRTNTAAVTLQNYNYYYDLPATLGGTTLFEGMATVDVSQGTINAEDECIMVTDSKMGNLGQVCASQSPKTFAYDLAVGPYDTCGLYQVDNTATFTALDSGSTGSSSANVNVEVPCVSGGCSLTPGYWKTHSKYGPAKYDSTWALVQPNGEDTIFFLSGKSYYKVLWTEPKGNAYYILAHAYIATYLNGLNDADLSAVKTQYEHAAQLLLTYKPTTEPSGALKEDFTKTAQILDNYNNGLIGPGHCD